MAIVHHVEAAIHVHADWSAAYSQNADRQNAQVVKGVCNNKANKIAAMSPTSTQDELKINPAPVHYVLTAPERSKFLLQEMAHATNAKHSRHCSYRQAWKHQKYPCLMLVMHY